MKNIALSIIMILIIVSCRDNKNTSKLIDKATSIQEPNFHYKDILLDMKNATDTIQPKNIKEIFGIWKLDSIAKIGGTMADEQLIQSQIGHQLLISDSLLSLQFLNQNIKIDKPKYSLVKSSDDIRCTTWFYGYKDGRKYVTSLKAHRSYFFEIVNYHELAYYYDGRIYFFKRSL